MFGHKIIIIVISLKIKIKIIHSLTSKLMFPRMPQRPLLALLAVLFLEEPLFHFAFLLFDALPPVDGSEVNETQSVGDQRFLDLLVDLRVRVKARRVVHLVDKTGTVAPQNIYLPS